MNVLGGPYDDEEENPNYYGEIRGEGGLSSHGSQAGNLDRARRTTYGAGSTSTAHAKEKFRQIMEASNHDLGVSLSNESLVEEGSELESKDEH